MLDMFEAICAEKFGPTPKPRGEPLPVVTALPLPSVTTPPIVVPVESLTLPSIMENMPLPILIAPPSFPDSISE